MASKKTKAIQNACPYCGSQLDKSSYVGMMELIRRKYADIMAEQVTLQQEIEKILERNLQLEKEIAVNKNRINHMTQLEKSLGYELGKIFKMTEKNIVKKAGKS